MEKSQQRLSAFLAGLSVKQRVMLVASILLLAGTVYGFVLLLDASEYKTLFSGMAPSDAQSLVQRLSAQNILYKISPDGTSVQVRSSDLDKARIEAAQGPIASGRLGFELFDKPNWSGSDFSEKVNYQRALEAELERTIQTMNGVESVRVHLVLPRESLFRDKEHTAKAAVLVKFRGARLSDAVSASIANLVSSAWDDLAPQDVTVISSDGQMPVGGHPHGGLNTAANMELEATLAERVVQTLAPVVGNDNVKSSITIDYDATSGESTQELYDPSNAAVLTSQSSQETVGDLEPSGIPGTASNAPNSQGGTAAVAQAKASNSTQGIRSESKTFAISHTTRHLFEPAGRIKRVAAAILVGDVTETKTEKGKTEEVTRKRSPEEMKQIEALAKAAIGYDQQRGDQFSLQNISFTRVAADVPVPPGKLQKFVIIAERWTGLLRYVGLLLLFAVVYLLILAPVKKKVIHVLENVRTPALLGGSGSGAAALGGGGASASAGAGEVALAGATPEVQRAVQLKKQIVAKVKEDPESASRLIQNWVREEEL